MKTDLSPTNGVLMKPTYEKSLKHLYLLFPHFRVTFPYRVIVKYIIQPSLTYICFLSGYAIY